MQNAELESRTENSLGWGFAQKAFSADGLTLHGFTSKVIPFSLKVNSPEVSGKRRAVLVKCGQFVLKS